MYTVADVRRTANTTTYKLRDADLHLAGVVKEGATGRYVFDADGMNAYGTELARELVAAVAHYEAARKLEG